LPRLCRVPLAAQTAIAIGYFQGGVLGATLVGFAFIVPPFLLVLALFWLYVTFGRLPWMQALFYGIGAVVIAIIAIAAYRLARGTNKRDPVLWGIFSNSRCSLENRIQLYQRLILTAHRSSMSGFRDAFFIMSSSECLLRAGTHYDQDAVCP
jgi:hypothetical protein